MSSKSRQFSGLSMGRATYWQQTAVQCSQSVQPIAAVLLATDRVAADYRNGRCATQSFRGAILRRNRAGTRAGIMRIIGGKWRSRRIEHPPTTRTRPMPDRVREAVFDILASWFDLPGGIPEIAVADMFAGSGSLGLEAVSRGASGCDFFERAGTALATLKSNLQNLAAGPECRVLRVNAWTCPLTTPRPAAPYGILFVDPPYADARDMSPAGRVPRLLNDLYLATWAGGDSLIVLHHEDRVQPDAGSGSAWCVRDRRVYSSTGITFVTAAPRPVDSCESIIVLPRHKFGSDTDAPTVEGVPRG
jgi:16S rRNA (guanine966-N2)-methyltransferase